MENKDFVLFEKKEDIAFVTFNRPEAMNALSTKVNIRLGEILDMAEMEETVKVVIAAINGFCLGGGLEYAMACDFRVASETAKFGFPEINIGIMPGSSGTQRLPRLIGMGMAKELIMSGTLFDAKTALDMGVVNHLFPRTTLLEETLKIAKQIASKSSVALSLIKSAMNRGTEVDLETGFQFEMDCFGLCFATEEQKQAMKTFVKK